MCEDPHTPRQHNPNQPWGYVILDTLMPKRGNCCSMTNHLICFNLYQCAKVFPRLKNYVTGFVHKKTPESGTHPRTRSTALISDYL